MKTSETIQELAKALSALQGIMAAAKEDTANSFFNSTYSNLTSIWNALREPLAKSELCVVQDALTLQGGVSVTTRVMHVSGEWIEFGPLIMPLGKATAHATGSAITYAKRYGLSAALGIVSEMDDDDGNKAEQTGPATQTPAVVSNLRPAPPKIKDVNIDKWYEEMHEFYDIEDLQEFVKDCVEKMGKDKQTVINLLVAIGPEKFGNQFDNWKHQ